MAVGRQQFHCTECGLDFSGRMSSTGKIYAYDRAPDAGHPPRQDAICMDCAAKAEEAAEPPDVPVAEPVPAPLTPETEHQKLLGQIAGVVEALTEGGIALDRSIAFLLLIVGCGTLHALGESDAQIEKLYKSAQDSAAQLWDYLNRAAKQSGDTAQ